MSYLLIFAAMVLLVVAVVFALSASALLLGMLLALVFPVTTFQGALLSTLLAVGTILTILLTDLERIGEAISLSLKSLQEEEEEEEEEEEPPSLRLAPYRKAGKKRVGRNDPCPCGSGKKYKNCCLGREV